MLSCSPRSVPVLGVEHDEAGAVRCGNVGVGPIHAVAGRDEDFAIHDEGEAGGGVVLEDAEFFVHVVNPEDVRIGVAGGDRGGVFAVFVERGHEGVFFLHALVAIAEAFHIHADDLAAVAGDVGFVADDGGAGADAEVFPVVDLAGAHLRGDELPFELAGVFIEDHDDAAVAGVLVVTGGFVVRADIDLAVGDHRSAVGLGAELGHPEAVLGGAHVNVLGSRLLVGGLGIGTKTSGDLGRGLGAVFLAGIEVDGQSFFIGHHVAGVAAAPLGVISGLQRSRGRKSQGEEEGGFCGHVVGKSGVGIRQDEVQDCVTSDQLFGVTLRLSRYMRF
jgi:hypothetical protein